ncbi:MAG: LemA family protein, partial [Bdellovibrionota bacterium]
DVILKQRHDEIPNLVSVCEQFAGFERGTLDRLMKARQNYGLATGINEKVKTAHEVSRALGRIFALSEAYPELKSSEQFSHLQKRISQLEDQIADRRELFNETVTNFNTRCQQFPDLFFTRILGYGPMELFKVESFEKEMPKVKMRLPAA